MSLMHHVSTRGTTVDIATHTPLRTPENFPRDYPVYSLGIVTVVGPARLPWAGREAAARGWGSWA